MKRLLKTNSISVKLGLLLSGIFITLLLILGFILYGVFTHLFVDYIKQDLLVRGNNHAKVLEEQFNQATIEHVVRMETGVKTNVLITDSQQRILSTSMRINRDVEAHLLAKNKSIKKGFVLESDWNRHDYLITVSPIGKNEGYVYMYYPSSILREIVMVINLLMIVSSIGILFLAFGMIGILSKRVTKPLLIMKEATNEMSTGNYKQRIPVMGNDEIAQLGYSIQSLGEQLDYYENSRNEFLASVSHELRTPLTYIKGYSDILIKGMDKSSEERGEYLKIINEETKRITLLVNELFDLSKLQAGKFELEKEWTNINAIIQKVITNLKPAAEKKGLHLLGGFLDIPKIQIDARKMEQVFYNLIENAVKYTNQGEISIRTYLEKEFIITKITDTGIGIPMGDLPKIWDQFYRVDQSRTRKTGGAGLGLFVVKKIIESHNGDITVESIVNKGTTFTIYLKNK